MCTVYLNDLFEIISRLNMLKQPKYNSQDGSNSLRYQGAKLWNAVYSSVKAASNYNGTKNALALLVISTCSMLCDIYGFFIILYDNL